jgi:hypothetical protein
MAPFISNLSISVETISVFSLENWISFIKDDPFGSYKTPVRDRGEVTQEGTEVPREASTKATRARIN